MNLHPTANTPAAQRYADRADEASDMADNYRRLQALATELGMTAEATRCGRLVNEYEDDAEENRMSALQHGYDPDLG